jgi:hypothetical protein
MGRKCAIEDQIFSSGRVTDVSVPMLLPCSFVGSAKWYHMLYLDALTLPQRYHAPDLFITFTCNPHWIEIQRELPAGHTYHDHPDIVARVFWLKFKELMKDIVTNEIFGPVHAFVWRIEWQARGLPHVHLLVILVQSIRSTRQIDAVVSAEIPDPNLFPTLYSVVQEFQLHTPCDDNPSAGCRDNPKRSCKRYFPKDMARLTHIVGNGYPKYRRRGRFTCQVNGRIITDDWVVPYNPFLSLKYRAHINIEVASSIKSFKYVYKYVLKSPDVAVLAVNEIEAFLSGRLLSAAEAVWRLLGLPLHKEYPTVMRLHLHLPNEHTVIFDPTADEENIQDATAAATSTLLEWFELNKRDPAARRYAYAEIPEHYVWSNSVWSLRRRGTALGRMYAVSSRNQELFALKRLLTVVRGANGWDDLRRVDDVCYGSFYEACRARGMLADDGDIVEAFSEIVRTSCSITNNREQFVMLLLNRSCLNVPQFFAMMQEHLCDDHVVNPTNCAVALWEMEDFMQSHGRSFSDHDFGMSLPERPRTSVNSRSRRWLNHTFDQVECIAQRDASVSLFTAEQQHALTKVLDSVDGRSSTNVFAVLSSAGCGKSMWINGLTWSVRAAGGIVLNVAASALAATLLPEGSTAHSTFRIPIPTTAESYCGVKGSDRELIRQCRCICYDEVSMVSMAVAECLNRFLQDVMQSSAPFGGKVIVFSGDFKQLLPVDKKKYPATIKQCAWWVHVEVIRFTINFRALQNPEFVDFLENVGNGRLTKIPIPERAQVSSIPSMIRAVYSDDMASVSGSRHMIMAFTLKTCDEINAQCMAKIETAEMLAAAFDDTKDNRQPDFYTPEYLAALPLHGVPPALLSLKPTARYIITKNFNPDAGVCNGTLCELLHATRSLAQVCICIATVELKIMIPMQVRLTSGRQAGRIIALPRMSCHVSQENSGLPFAFSRVQFPLMPAYCVSVHKSQGQTLERIGIIVDQDSFAHGQLYTAFSRTGGWMNISVYVTSGDDFVTNLVHRSYL